MKKILLLSIFIFLKYEIFAQNIFFEKEYGDGVGRSVQEIGTGSKYLIGSTKGIFPTETGYIFSINDFGDTIKTFAFPNSSCNSVIENSRGYIIVGDSCCNLTGVAHQTDTSGTILWTTFFLSTFNGSTASSITKYNDNKFFLLHSDDGTGANNPDMVALIDSSGSIIHDTTVFQDGVGLYLPSSILMTGDAGAIVISQGGLSDVFKVTKLDSSGNVTWSKYFADSLGANGFFANTVTIADSSYLISGKILDYQTGQSSAFLIKMDSIGSINWWKIYNNNFDNVELIKAIKFQNEISAVGVSANAASSRIVLYKIDLAGDTIWTREFIGRGFSRANDFIVDSSGYPTIVGYTSDSLTGQRYIYVIKTDTLGLITYTQNVLPNNNIKAYPNPVIDRLIIDSNLLNGESEIEITNLFGNIVQTIKGFKNKINIDFTNYLSGIYFILLHNNNNLFITKVIKI